MEYVGCQWWPALVDQSTLSDLRNQVLWFRVSVLSVCVFLLWLCCVFLSLPLVLVYLAFLIYICVCEKENK